MKTVYILWHTHVDERLDGGEDIKLIGVYSSEEQAVLAQQRVEFQPGFKDCKEGFEIVPYRLNEDHWTEGFVTSVWRAKKDGTPDRRYRENRL